uniref:Uncharacterized protein n=1 Tax=Arundo donax TaxID=35708 RepID=A0A0A9AFN3_ARUDO
MATSRVQSGKLSDISLYLHAVRLVQPCSPLGLDTIPPRAVASCCISNATMGSAAWLGLGAPSQSCLPVLPAGV